MVSLLPIIPDRSRYVVGEPDERTSRAAQKAQAYLSWWLENEVLPNQSARTYQEYEVAVCLYIVPKKLDRLNAIDITT